MQTTTAIILVGGRGTRLGSLTDSRPKPLLPVAGRPFLFHLLDYLIEQGIKSVILSTGYLANQFDSTLGTSYKGLSITYAVEESPLGTGGAIHNAFTFTDTERAFVVNGDTLFQANLNTLEQLHFDYKATVTLALRAVADVSRYGHVTLDGVNILRLNEKGTAGPGLINGGTYLIERKIYKDSPQVLEHSFEKTSLPSIIAQGGAYGLSQAAYFIDIGVPADLEKAGRDLA